MKARPILFSGPMIRALLAGTKTQTRRVVKNPDEHGCLTGDCPHESSHQCVIALEEWCPYGKPGDLLWVREAFRGHGDDEQDGLPPSAWRNRDCISYEAHGEPGGGAWVTKCKPGIHMPRWASRLTLRITDVRVERLQDISEVDAVAEGITPFEVAFASDKRRHKATDKHPAAVRFADAYCDLWESINGPESWDANPWVWAITFGVIRQNVDAVLKA